MSDNPTTDSGNAANLGSAYYTIGALYDREQVAQFFRDTQAIADLQKRTASQPLVSPQQVQQVNALTTAAERLRNTLTQRAAGTDPLSAQAQQQQAALQRLQERAETLRATLATIGIRPDQLKPLLDAEGRVRDSVQAKQTAATINQKQGLFGTVRTSADARFEALQQRAEPGTALANLDFGDVNGVKALAESARDANAELKSVESQMRALQSTALPRTFEEAATALRELTDAEALYTQTERQVTGAIEARAAAQQRVAALEAQLSGGGLSDQAEVQATEQLIAAYTEITEQERRALALEQQMVQATERRGQALAEVERRDRQINGAPATTTQIKIADVSDRTLALETEKQRTAEIQRQNAELKKQATVEAAIQQRQGADTTAAALVTAEERKLEAVRIASATRTEVADKRLETTRIAGTNAAAVEELRLQRVREQGANRQSLQTERLAAQAARQSAPTSSRSGLPILPRTIAGLSDEAADFAKQMVGVAGAAGVAYVGLQQLRSGFELRGTIQETTRSLGVFLGDVDRGNDVMAKAIEFGRKYGFTQEEITKGLASAGRLLKNSSADIETVLSVLSRLATLSPEQGIQGAVIAIQNLAAGGNDAITSLVNRFEFSQKTARGLAAEIKGGKDAVTALGGALDAMGVTNELLEKRTQGPLGAIRDLKIAIEDLKLAAADFAVGAGLTDWLKSNAHDLENLAKVLSHTKTEAKVTQDAFNDTTGFDAYSAAIDKVNEFNLLDLITGGDKEGIGGVTNQVDKLTASQYRYAKSLQDSGTPTEEAIRLGKELGTIYDAINSLDPERGGATLQKYATRLIELASQGPAAAAAVKDLGDAFVQTGDEDALLKGMDALSRSTGRETEETNRLSAFIRALGGDYTDAALKSETLQKAQDALADSLIASGKQLADAEQQHTDDLASAAQDYQEHVDEINDKIAQSQQDQQDAITDAVADASKARTKIADDEAKAIGKITSDYAEQRTELIQEQADAETKINDDRRRDNLAAEQAYNEHLLGLNESFTQKVFDLFRGKRGQAGKRDEALAALRQVEADANALYANDAQARQEYIDAKSQQILDGIERSQDAAAQLRDAKRGSAGFSQADAKAEQDAETAAIDASNQAILDGIKARADGRIEEQQREDTERTEGNQKALDKLDEQEADAIQNVKDNTKEQLAALDERQKERIAQIEKQGAEQREALGKELDKEAEQYQQKQDEINADYEAFLSELRTTLQEGINNLAYTPDEQKQQEIRDTLRALGITFGTELANAIQAGLDATEIKPPPIAGDSHDRQGGGSQSGATTGGRTYGRGSRTEAGSDTVLSDQAIDQIVVGGRQSGSFHGDRGGDLHAGVDIATPLNSDVRSPVDGTVTSVGETAAGGKYIIVTGPRGEQWYFGHLNRALFARGAQVKRGQVIAKSGNTGSAVEGRGHVHVQLRQPTGGVVDPTANLEAIAAAARTAPVASSSASAGGSGRVNGQSVTGGGSGSGALGREFVPFGPGANLPALPGGTVVSAPAAIGPINVYAAPGMDERALAAYTAEMVDQKLNAYHTGLLEDVGHQAGQGRGA